MMLALITISAEAENPRKAPREGEKRPKAPVSRPRPLISQSSAIDLISELHVPLCDFNEFVVRSGTALVEFIQSESYECVSRLFNTATEQIRMAAFQQENMIYVAGATAQFATTYDGTDPQDRLSNLYYFRFSCRFGGSDLCWRAWPMDAAAIVENAGNSGRERRLGKGCEHVQTWSGVFHNRLENASRFPRAPTGPS